MTNVQQKLKVLIGIPIGLSALIHGGFAGQAGNQAYLLAPAPLRDSDFNVTLIEQNSTATVDGIGPAVGWLDNQLGSVVSSDRNWRFNDPTSWKRPSWLTDLSSSIEETYDDNIYLSGVDQKYLPTSFTVPPGSAIARKDESSYKTTVSLKIGVDLAPLIRDGNILKVFSLVYAPDFVFYHDAPIENHKTHRFTTKTEGGTGSFSFSLENALNFVQGSNVGPTYPGGFLNAYSATTPREHREQVNGNASFSCEYDYDNWFVSPVASLLYYDMMTQLHNITGYLNYANRYDVNGGVDFGYRVEPQLAITLGYRYGHQYQEQFSFSRYSSSSNYQRALLGIEGKPWKWLDVNIHCGPDFRSYPQDTASHITPVTDKHPVYYYGEANITATVTSRDTVTFKYKQWMFVSQLGNIPYFDSTYELSYHHKWNERLTLDLIGSILSSDYTSGNLPSSRRDDYEYTISAGFDYSFNPHFSANLAYSFYAGRNGLDGVVNPSTRSFDENVVSIGALLKF